MKNCDTRHVCFKDLEEYVRKDDYFKNYTDSELEEIYSNLKLSKFSTEAIAVTYSELKELIDNSQLAVGHTYIIKDFQTYPDLINNGSYDYTQECKSETYQIVTTALTRSKIDLNVVILSDSDANSTKWIVRYDPTQENTDIPTKGKITYMLDENGNSAYYDFKNMRFTNILTEITSPVYTFNKNAINVHIGEKASESLIKAIFLDNANNVTIDDASGMLIFKKSVSNVTIKNNVVNVFYGKLSNVDIKKGISYGYDSISGDIENGELDGRVHSYLDPETLTYQIETI